MFRQLSYLAVVGISGLIAQANPSLWDKTWWVLIGLGGLTVAMTAVRELKRRIDYTDGERVARIAALESDLRDCRSTKREVEARLHAANAEISSLKTEIAELRRNGVRP